MLKNLLSPKRRVFSAHRPTATYINVHRAYKMHLLHVSNISDVLLTYVEFYIFVNMPGARLAYTAITDNQINFD